MILEHRSVIGLGESHAITLPCEWLKTQDTKNGDRVLVCGSSFLLVAHDGVEEELIRAAKMINSTKGKG